MPVSSFVLDLPTGPNSALASNGTFCNQTLVMPTTITAQSGKQIKQNTNIAVAGCTGGKRARIKILSRRIKHHKLVLRIQTFAAGRVSVKSRNLRANFRRVNKPSKITIKVPLSRSGAKALSAHRRLKFKVRVGFLPKAKAESVSVTSTTVKFKRLARPWAPALPGTARPRRALLYGCATGHAQARPSTEPWRAPGRRRSPARALPARRDPGRAFADAPEVTVSLAPAELTLGAPLDLTGRVAQSALPIAGAPLALQADPYPYRGFATIARGVSAPDGSFAFTDVHPALNTRLRVLVEGAARTASAVLDVIVDPQVALNATSLGPGRSRLSVRISHAPQGASGPVSARWFAAARGTHVFHLVAITATREASSGLTYASATIDPPAKRFVYRVCLNPAWERAMGSPASHGPCPQRDYTAAHDVALPYEGEGSGIPVAAYPSAGAIAAAARFLDSRAGRTSLAVVDSQGRLSGLRLREHFQTASVVKVMMLVAYLQMLNAHHRGWALPTPRCSIR